MENNWAWGLSLITLTIAVHATGLASIAFALLRIRLIAQTHRRFRLHDQLIMLIALITAVGLLLGVLHGIEAGLWAVAYVWLGALKSPWEAFLYSVDSMSTRGASGLMLEHYWRMMGALEAMDGMLLFGISTAFLFAVMQGYWVSITEPLRR